MENCRQGRCLALNGDAVRLKNVSQSPDFFSRKPRHYGNTGDVGRPSTDAILGSRDVDEGGFGDFGELAVADAKAEENFGNGSQDDEESVEDLFLNMVLHAR